MRSEFIEAAVWHGSLDRAESIRVAHPDVADSDIHTAAILGDAAAVRRFLEQDPANATRKGGPREWDALTHLCFSRYLRLDAARSAGFVRAATDLLDAGASATTGFYDRTHTPEPEWESALYGAAGVAHHAALTRVLLDRGADPNDNEVPYHAPETFDNEALRALVECGRLSDDSLETMLLRKTDWHDHAGLAYLLAHGADPNRMRHWPRTALNHAVRRDNALANVELLLAHGGDPALTDRRDDRSALAIAVRRGRRDLLEAFVRRGVRIERHGVERLIAACATDDRATVEAIVRHEPLLVREVLVDGGTLLAEFAGNGNTEGVRHLLNLGVNVTALYESGDSYFEIAPNSMAIHVAAWRARHETVRLLIERRTPLDVRDAKGRTPLSLAVRACVDSYWADRRSPESVQRLLRAGASVQGVDFPSGYAEIDELLKSHGARPA